MEYGLWINGQWQAGSGTVDVENPATGKTVAQVATAGEQEVNAAVAANPIIIAPITMNQ